MPEISTLCGDASNLIVAGIIRLRKRPVGRVPAFLSRANRECAIRADPAGDPGPADTTLPVNPAAAMPAP
jgi:hypothetical protein